MFGFSKERKSKNGFECMDCSKKFSKGTYCYGGGKKEERRCVKCVIVEIGNTIREFEEDAMKLKKLRTELKGARYDENYIIGGL